MTTEEQVENIKQYVIEHWGEGLNKFYSNTDLFTVIENIKSATEKSLLILLGKAATLIQADAIIPKNKDNKIVVKLSGPKPIVDSFAYLMTVINTGVQVEQSGPGQ